MANAKITQQHKALLQMHDGLPNILPKVLKVLGVSMVDFKDSKGRNLAVEIEMTPKKAHELMNVLKANQVNRDPKENNIRKLMESMVEGTFGLTADAMVLSHLGYILNGGNRCRSLSLLHTLKCAASIKVSWFVAIGFRPEEYLKIGDTNCKRTANDADRWNTVITKYFIPSVFQTQMASVAGMGYEGMKRMNKKPSASDRRCAFMAKHRKEFKELDNIYFRQKFTKTISHLKRAFIWKALLHYLILDNKKATQFICELFVDPGTTGTHVQTRWCRAWLDENCQHLKNGHSIIGYKAMCSYIYDHYKNVKTDSNGFENQVAVDLLDPSK